jgi:perosamine synthetase
MIPRFDFTYTFRDFVGEIKYNSKGQKPDLTSLEDYFGGHPLIFVEKARVGICMVLQTLDLKPGSIIGVQPFTCSSVLFAIKNAGFNILFIDIDPDFRFSHKDLILKNQKIDALIVTHTFGYPEDTEALKLILGNKPVIEDCAQAFLSEFKGSPVGLSGDAGVFSTGFGKLFGIGSGGFIVSRNNTIHSKLMKLNEKLQYPSDMFILKDRLKSLVLGVLYKSAVYSSFTFPFKNKFRKSNIGIQEYPKSEQLLPFSRIELFKKRFSANLHMMHKQQENGKLLLNLINKRFNSITPLDGSRPNFFLVPLQVKNRDLFIAHLEGKGIEAGKHFSNSIHWVRSFGYVEGECPNFERIAGEVITLPCHHYLSAKKIKYIAESLNAYHEGN